MIPSSSLNESMFGLPILLASIYWTYYFQYGLDYNWPQDRLASSVIISYSQIWLSWKYEICRNNKLLGQQLGKIMKTSLLIMSNMTIDSLCDSDTHNLLLFITSFPSRMWQRFGKHSPLEESKSKFWIWLAK